MRRVITIFGLVISMVSRSVAGAISLRSIGTSRRGTILYWLMAPLSSCAKSRHGIIDDELCHDAHHPTLASHLNLAQAILDQLHQRRALGLGGAGARAPIINPAECAVPHFQIDSQVWAAVCVKAGIYFTHLGAARYDPAEREAKHLRFEQAAVQIRQGVRLPEEAGIPGVGLPPPVDWAGTGGPSREPPGLHSCAG